MVAAAISEYSGISPSLNGQRGSKDGSNTSTSLKSGKASKHGSFSAFTSTSSSRVGESRSKSSIASPSLRACAYGKHPLVGMAGANTICYGMLIKLPLEHDENELPVVYSREPATLRGCRVFLLDNPPRHIGDIERRTAHILRKLAKMEEVFLQFEIHRRDRKQRRSLDNETVSKKLVLELSVILYGPLDESDSVGDFLLAFGLYLQDPQRCDLQVPYRNPQSLWARKDGEIRATTKDNAVVSEQQFFKAPADLLQGLEYEDKLLEWETPSALKSELRPHQKQALFFMLKRESGWNFQRPLDDIWRAQRVSPDSVKYVNTVTGAEREVAPPDFKGGILADQMGLGKTLSIIALIAQDKYGGNPMVQYNNKESVGSTLIVVRASLIHVWEDQLKKHVQCDKLRWKLHRGNTRLKSLEDLASTDIVLTTYQTLVKDNKREELPFVYHVQWDRIVLDEAHDIRDHARLTAKAMRDLKAVYRWAVTGTPIQNSLSDIASLYQFLRIDPYTNDPTLFNEHINQLWDQKSDEAMSKAKRLIRCIMLRRSIQKLELPERKDWVSRLDFSAEEAKFYDQAKIRTGSLLDDALNGAGLDLAPRHILPWLNSLRMICNHGTRAKLPQTLVTPTDAKWNKNTAQEMFNALITTGEAICEVCRTDLGAVATEVADHPANAPTQSQLASCAYLVCGPCMEHPKGSSHRCTHSPPHVMEEVSTLSSFLPREHDPVSETAAVPTKVKKLLEDLDIYVEYEKFVVFSFWTSTLDIIEQEITKRSIGYIRFDGKVSNTQRDKRLDSFKEDENVRVALLSITCGAVGLDLTSASRAYLMEPHWNPSVEQQALARIYRMGQTRKVTTVRYVMRDSIEEYVLNVQNKKQRLTEKMLSPESQGDSETAVDRLKQIRSFITGGSNSN